MWAENRDAAITGKESVSDGIHQFSVKEIYSGQFIKTTMYWIDRGGAFRTKRTTQVAVRELLGKLFLEQ